MAGGRNGQRVQKRTTFTFKGQKTHFIHNQKRRKEKQLQQANRTDDDELDWDQNQRANAARNIGGNSFSQRKLPGKYVTLTRDVSCGGGGIAHGAVHYVSERPAKGHAVAQVGLLKQKNNSDCRTRLCCLHSTHKMPRYPRTHTRDHQRLDKHCCLTTRLKRKDSCE